MGMISHGIALGVGYTCAHPEGRRRLLSLRDQVLDRRRRREVTPLRERARDIATAKVMAAKISLEQKIRRSNTRPTPANSAAGADADTEVGLDAALAGHAGRPHSTSAPLPPAEQR